MLWTCPLLLALFASSVLADEPSVPEIRGRSPVPLSTKTVAWPRFTLRADKYWQLNPPKGERFDASALLLRPNGDLLTLNDRGPAVYRIKLPAAGDSAELVPVEGLFRSAALRPLDPKAPDRYDCEGLAQDGAGWVYLCEEGRRWILKSNEKSGAVERLEIDWTPVKKYFHPFDYNASFEGIAIGGGKLYVANERQMGRIIVVDLATKKIEADFTARPGNGNVGDIHYSDLSWFDGHLYALLRHHRAVLKIQPGTWQVLAEYQFREMEEAPEVAYRKLYPTGTMEGLAVSATEIWLVTDNNGKPRVKHPKDIRPTLFRCPMPR